MRSKLIIVATVVASVVLTSQMATADPVQEQLRLMEQRMAEMEDRLQATSDELRSARSVVDQQQGLLTNAGLIDESDEGLRSGVSDFIQQVDISGVLAVGYNQRFMGSGDANVDNVGLFRHPNANTFTFDQFWLAIDKAPTEESRAGFHVDFVSGVGAVNQFGGNNGAIDSPQVYSAFVSYLAPIGSGVQIDAGKLATPFGAEVLQANQNLNITQGLVWGLQPVTHTGVQISGNITDEFSATFGVVNDVYSDTSIDDSRDKAYYGQLAFSGEKFGVSAGAIVGKDSSSGYVNENGVLCRSGDECMTSVFNFVATADPTDDLSMWLDFTWVRAFGDDMRDKGDRHGVSVAGRWGFAENTGIAGRIEYVRTDNNYMRAVTVGPGGGETGEVMSYTLTGDHALTDDLTLRLEARWDRNLSNSPLFANSSSQGNTTKRSDQLVGLAELMYSF